MVPLRWYRPSDGSGPGVNAKTQPRLRLSTVELHGACHARKRWLSQSSNMFRKLARVLDKYSTVRQGQKVDRLSNPSERALCRKILEYPSILVARIFL